MNSPRWLALLVIVLISTSCATKPSENAQGNQRPQPTPVPRGDLPSSDEVWLVEMLIQRLEISAALFWTDPKPADPAAEQANLQATIEEARRIGLPPSLSRRVFSAQVAAANLQGRELEKELRKDPQRQRPIFFKTALRNQLGAVDTQIMATLRRLKRVPAEKRFLEFARDSFSEREISKKVTRLALKPFEESRETRKATTRPTPAGTTE